MKRGLVVRDAAEVSDAEWDGRIRTLQSVMADRGLDMVLVYGDVSRSDDIGYLTNLCIYWNEGIVAVPSSGDPIFLTKLSPRVHTWMRAISTVSDIRSGPGLGKLVGELVADRSPGVLGLVDAALWPGTVIEDIHTETAGWEVRSLGPVVRNQRAVPSPAELTLLRRAARSVSEALDAAAVSGPGSAEERVALLERELRAAGFADLFATAAPAPDGLNLSVTGEFRHGWVHAGRIVAESESAPWVAALRRALDDVIGAAHGGADAETLYAAAEQALSDLPATARWDVRCVNQADLATHGELSAGGSDERLATGAVVTIGIELAVDAAVPVTVAETVLLTEEGPEVLTTTRHTKAGSPEEALA